MGHGHGHGHGLTGEGLTGEKPRPASFRARMVLLATLGPIALLTVIGALLLYPYGGVKTGVPKQYEAFTNGQARIVAGTVTAVTSQPCPGTGEEQIADGGGPGTCQTVKVRLTEGAEDGKQVQFDVGAANGTPPLANGERITVARTTVEGTNEVVYSFNDIDRGWSLLLLAVVFGVVVVAVARWKGLAALIGVGITALILVGFLVPALLAGSSPVLVGLVAASLILYAVLYLAHGRTAQTSTALLGTLFGMGASAGLSALAVGLTHVTGLSSEETSSLQVASATVPVSGLLLCGFIIGSLGVLNDVTVSQASSVWALADADPTLSGRRLFALAMRIGRDHIASAVYTLVLAYAGSALPIMLLFTMSRMPVGTVLTSDQIAVEVVRSLVGGIALALSVPITTAVAAAVVRSGQAGSGARARALAGGPDTDDAPEGGAPEGGAPDRNATANRANEDNADATRDVRRDGDGRRRTGSNSGATPPAGRPRPAGDMTATAIRRTTSGRATPPPPTRPHPAPPPQAAPPPETRPRGGAHRAPDE